MPETAQSKSETFGCDRCAHPKDAHKGDPLTCPVGGSQYSNAHYSEPLRLWIDDGHRLAAELHFDSFIPVILCGDKCTRPICCCQGEDGERPVDPNCDDCNGSGVIASQCALRVWWADDPAWAMEQTRWAHTTQLPAPIIWWGGYDDFEWRPRDVASDA